MRRLLPFLILVVLLLPSWRPAFGADPETTSAPYFDQIREVGIIYAGICTFAEDATLRCSECRDKGNCTLQDVLQVFVNISNFILGIVGSLVLLFFVWGGILWLTSGGSQEKIEKGTSAIRGAVIGLLIVFGAFAGINFLTSSLRSGTAGQINKCELVSPEHGGKAGLGYACLDFAQLQREGIDDEFGCLTGLCPGPGSQEEAAAESDIRCCIQKSASSSSSSSSN